ncbi:unnamed protein product, partial [Ectocarpus sp. 12 AP-2014]
MLSVMADAKAAAARFGPCTAGRNSLVFLALMVFAGRGCLSFVPFPCPSTSARYSAVVAAGARSGAFGRQCRVGGVRGDRRGPTDDGRRARIPSCRRPAEDLELGAAGVGGAGGEGFEEKGEEVDVVVVGAGIGGLTCAALLAQYGLDVTVCESHTIPGGCAHSFERDGYKFDSGPSIFSGFTGPVPNPLKQQVLNVLEEELPCIRYDGWGNLTPSGYFKFDLGPDSFRDDVLKRLGGPDSAQQFDRLLGECQPLMEAASALPSLSLRSDKWAAVTMLRFLPGLLRVIPLADELNGPFRPK